MTGNRIVLREHRAILLAESLLIASARHVHAGVLRIAHRFGLAQHLGGLHHQPGALNIVAEGDFLRSGLPVACLEVKVVMNVMIDDLVEHHIKMLADLVLHEIALIGTQQAGVRFDQMQMVVHGLFVRGQAVDAARPGIARPVRLAGLEISLVNRVVDMLFEGRDELPGIFQRFVAAHGPSIFGQAVDGKRFAVDIALLAHRIAELVHTVVGGVVFVIPEILDEVVVGAIRHLLVFGIAHHAISRREGPDQTRVKCGTGALSLVTAP